VADYLYSCVYCFSPNLTEADNPGAWFLHCHIDWHLEAGLAIAFAEAPEDNISGPAAQITPQDWLDLCPEYDALDPELQ
jgi:iron transport multicopper oxidase